jgi:hypothetical protein
VAGAAADVEHAHAALQRLGEARHRADETRHQMLVEDAPPRIVHAAREHRPVRRVRHAAATAKTAHQRRQVRAEVIDHAARWAQVRRVAAGERLCVFVRQGVALRRRVIGVDTAGRHATEPFAHIAFVQAGAFAQLFAARRTEPGRLEQAGLVADVDELRQHRAGVDVQHLPGEAESERSAERHSMSPLRVAPAAPRRAHTSQVFKSQQRAEGSQPLAALAQPEAYLFRPSPAATCARPRPTPPAAAGRAPRPGRIWHPTTPLQA